MESIYQAIQKLNYLKPNPVFIIHSNIVEINAEETAAAVEFNKKINAGNRPGFLNKETKKAAKTFKCLDCGYIWQENILAPLLMTPAEVNRCYPQAKNCSILK